MWDSFVIWLNAHWNGWVLFGFAGQALFMGRFLYQWLASERAGRSVVPEAFWYFSLIGGAMTFIYALHIQDPVFIIGQSAGLGIYLRNIHFIRRAKIKTA